MKKLLWFLSVISLPLIMIGEFRISGLPLTHLFLLILGLLDIKYIFQEKTGKIEKNIYFTYSFFIFLSILDLNRSYITNVNFDYLLKIILLLILIKFYSSFIFKYGLNFFLKWFALSSGIILVLLLFRSLYIFNASYFVVDPEQITESGKNQLAFYLGLSIPLIVWFAMRPSIKIILKLILFCSLIIHLFSAFYVQSKGLLLSAVVSFFLTIIFYSGINIKLGNILKVVFILLVSFYFIQSTDFIDLTDFKSEILNLISADTKNSNSSIERINFLKISFNYFLENPILGIGTNNFFNIEGKATHNNYLQILCENGLLGFFIFLRFLFITHNFLFKTKNIKIKYDNLLVVNCFWALTTYLFVINGFFNAITIIVLSLIIFYEKSKNKLSILPH